MPHLQNISHLQFNLIQTIFSLNEIIFSIEKRKRLILRSLERILVLPQILNPVQLFRSLLIRLVDLDRKRLQLGPILNSANNVFEVLEQAFLVLIGRLGLEQRDGLDLALQNEKAVVFEVDAAPDQQFRDGFVLHKTLVDVVLGAVVLVGDALDRERRVGHHLARVAHFVEEDFDAA